MRWWYMLCLSLVWIGQAQAVEWKDLGAVNSAVERFVEAMNRGEVAPAHRELRAHLGVSLEAFDAAVRDTVADMANLREQLGKPIGMVLVDKQAIGEDFYRLIYLQKYSSAAIVWELTFYRPLSTWLVVGVNYSADIDKLFQSVDVAPAASSVPANP
ncbi:MAG: hypothetical protein LPK85_06485 [Gammaproteobacteria bacterium]|nr:hypothetical protein [Gammaproteobacteria bacterium]